MTQFLPTKGLPRGGVFGVESPVEFREKRRGVFPFGGSDRTIEHAEPEPTQPCVDRRRLGEELIRQRLSAFAK